MTNRFIDLRLYTCNIRRINFADKQRKSKITWECIHRCAVYPPTSRLCHLCDCQHLSVC